MEIVTIVVNKPDSDGKCEACEIVISEDDILDLAENKAVTRGFTQKENVNNIEIECIKP